MLVTRVSPFSNKKHSIEIPVTMEQITKWKQGTPIQEAMPNLTPDQREFILTGITLEEWDTTFGKGE